MAKTTPIADDPNWWRDVFTQEEYDRLNTISTKIVSQETADPEEAAIEIAVEILRKDITPAIYALGEIWGNHPLTDKLLVALCEEYLENDSIAPDIAITTIVDRILDRDIDEGI